MKTHSTKTAKANRFVVLLRGVNVGKGNRVPMALFKKALEEIDCCDVLTLLNSGNAVFNSTQRNIAKHVTAISSILNEQFEVNTPVVVKTAAQFQAIVAHNPLQVPETDHSKFLVAFAQTDASIAELAQLLPQPQASEEFKLTATAAYIYSPSGILQSKLAAALIGKAGRNVTTRNWATVLKINARLT